MERRKARWSSWMWETLLWDRCPSRTSNTLTHIYTHTIPRALVSVVEAVACRLQSDRITLYHWERKKRKKQDACGGWQFDSSACYFHSWVHTVRTHTKTHKFTHTRIDWCTELHVYTLTHTDTYAWYIHNIIQSIALCQTDPLKSSSVRAGDWIHNGRKGSVCHYSSHKLI